MLVQTINKVGLNQGLYLEKSSRTVRHAIYEFRIPTMDVENKQYIGYIWVILYHQPARGKSQPVLI